MECQECHIRPATLHFTRVINGEKQEFHLCEQCAKEKGDLSDMMVGSGAFSIHNLLSGLLNFDQPMSESNSHASKHEELQCEKCGLRYREFTKIGKFGCDECYQAFESKLDPILRKVHSGNTVHLGKIPKRTGKSIGVKRRIAELKDQLKQLIIEEEFEKAASVRDEIRALENRGDV
ncbi:UvrB/UvrC motif-containing protein [Pullulanibacillus sp. KACC 23026]|uniref:UvrB/UvrC motif-containing protein n=1 Tax=Pullulanibacillus sp. KACC 23026 TaxID=3028315 RepID=UPI0023AE9C24|nr:UvrB/UvrC motif-containing protein [Pullulanibacillus sp. KACC 23026]WEG12701.1 UvrB/UvrC motif-containing protein [Pullulanibacillus sp. KACC 23026]